MAASAILASGNETPAASAMAIASFCSIRNSFQKTAEEVAIPRFRLGLIAAGVIEALFG